ncbi:MAG: polymer-forming cytoskeletal protein [Lactobacillaceae bacterium]|jgi:cytoskeletal protein CcmA (bactofilin family)|nr:polymer-forming cytoskeletal protein [Lactobacillaceae bacterium]
MKNLKRMLYLKFARRMSKSASENVPVPSIISNNTKIIGDISSSGILHIDGRVEGDILCEELVIGVKGLIAGSITANNLQIYGTLQGKATVDSLFIAKTAKLIGDASHSSIAIEPGAYIDGHCTHNGDRKRPDDLLSAADK